MITITAITDVDYQIIVEIVSQEKDVTHKYDTSSDWD
jgi:hypothetical protein